MTTDTAVTRLDAETNAAIGHPDAMVELTFADARALVQMIGNLCPTHQACELCQAAMCEDCAVNWPEQLPSDQCGVTHCEDCISDCRSCMDEVDVDRRGEAYDDAHGWRS